MNKIFSLKISGRFLVFMALVVSMFCANQSQAQAIATFPTTWSGIAASPLAASSVATNVASAQIARVGLTGVSSSARYNSSAWSAANYLTVTITASPGFVLNLNGKTLTAAMGSSGTGPNSFPVFSSVNSFASSIGTLNTSCTSTASTTITFPATGYNGLSTITFRITGTLTGCSSTFGSGGTGGPASLSITGTVAANGPTLALANNGTQTTAQNITANTSGNVIAKAQLGITGAAASISSMVFQSTAASTYLPADITSFRLYRSTNATYDGNAGTPTGSFIGSGVASTKTTGVAESITFSTAQNSLAIATYYYYLVADVASGASNAHTINIAAQSTTNITSAGSTISGSTSATGASTIANKPVVSSNPAISGTTGVPFSYNVVATQSPASYAITSGTLPPPLSLNSSTGVISGIPNTGGTYSVTVTATNTPGGVSDAATLGFTIATGSLTDQSITFTPFTTPVTYGDPTFNLSATATSGLPVSFSSDNAAVATISGTTVTITGAGTVNIIANQPGDGTTYAAATPDTLVLVVNKAILSITNPAVTTKTYDGTTAATITGTFTVAGGLVNAGDAAGLTLAGAGTFSSANAGPGITVTANCTISGTKAIDYTLVQPTGLTGTINKANQTITFAALTDKTVGSGSSTLTASSTSSLAITYTSSNPAVATVSGVTLTIVGLGSTIITASQTGNGNYNAATSVQQTLFVTPTPTTLASWSNVNSTASSTMTLSQSAANINTATTVTTGVGLTASSNGSRFSFTGWQNAPNSYVSVTVAASTGFILNLNSQSFSIALGSSNTGPGSFILYSSVNNYATPIGTLSSGASQTTTNVTLPASGYDGLSSVTFRVVGSTTALNGSATASGGTGGPSSISITGSVACTAPGTPTASTPAAVCQGTAATITGAGGSAGSYTFWTAASGGSSITTATTPPGTVASSKLTTPTSLAAGSYTYYVQGENAGGCVSAVRQAVTVSIVALPVSNAGNPATICNGGSTTLAANSPGVNTGVWLIVNGPSTDLAQFSSVSDPSATFTPNGGLGVYTLRWKVSNATCSATSDVAITSGGYSWTGAANSVWSNPANWTVCGIPTSGSDVSITNGTNAPVLDGDFAIGNLELQTNTELDLGGHTLTLNGAVSGDGTFKGSASSSMLISDGVDVGTITFSPGSTILKDFTINSSATARLGSSLDIAAGHNPGTLSVLGFLLIGDSLTLKSDINGTASAGNTDGGFIIGNVTVERYIPANSQRAWRLLSIPTQTTQTINQSWQEGFTQNVTGINGYGTIITAGASNSNWLADGFDTTQNSGSMLSYNQAANSWDEINTTNGATGSNPLSGNIATTSGYFLYIRGDRSQLPSGSTSGTTATVLRTTGPLYQGTQSPITVPGGNYGLIGNIYASAIDFTGLTLDADIDNKFYVWDPKLLDAPPSLGAYVTFSDVNNWIPVPGAANVGSYGNTANTLIQSGQAFFVHASNTANVTFTESAKVSGSAMVFRPAAPVGTSARITTNLYKVSGSTSILADGNVAVFNSNYSNAVDGNDALKLSNTVENFGLARNSKILVIEARQPVAVSDTIYFDMWNMQPQQQYKLEFTPDKLSANVSAAILEDNYLGTKTAVSLNTVTDINFTVNSNAASSASNRFRLILSGSSPVPVTFTSINAQLQNNNAATVSWKVSSAIGIKQYEVEYSTDDVYFTGIGTVSSKGNGTATYSLSDATVATGINYYRIKAIGDAGDITYSSIANVTSSTTSIPGITVYPNPASGNQIHLLLTNLSGGTYTARLLSVDGQELSSSSFKYDGTNNLQNISIPATIAAGTYKLEIVGKQVYTTTVVIN